MRRRLEGARLDHVAADLQKGFVDPLNDVWSGEDEMVVASLERLASEVLGCWMTQLNVGPHRAVEDEDALRQSEEIGMKRRVGHDASERKRPKRCAPGRRFSELFNVAASCR